MRIHQYIAEARPEKTRLFTYGLAKVSLWGAFKPLAVPFAIFGLSPSPFFIIVGILFVWFFSLYESYKERKNKPSFFRKFLSKTKLHET